MKKKVVYRLTRQKYEIVEVESTKQEEAIKELNRNFEREEKRNKTAQIRCVSIDAMQEEGFELKSYSQSIDEFLISREDKTYQQKIIHNALKILTKRQRQVVVMHFWENKTYRQIASILSIHFTTVAESYHSALKKIRKFLKNTPTKHLKLSNYSENQYFKELDYEPIR